MAEETKDMIEAVKDNTPAALKNNDLIDQYLDVVGEVFEEIRQDIRYKSFETDYANAKPETLVRVAADLGFNLSPKLRPSVLRRIIRDAQEVFSRMGTRESLVWALKTVGYRSYDIDEVWIPNPDLLRIGYFRELNSTSDPRRYEVRKGSYSDFVVGEEYVTAQGTFFQGYVYNDFEKEEPINNIPIYGERYSTYTGLSFKDMVSKTPYILVRLYDPPEYDDVIADTDPVTGDPVFVDIQEKQRIVINTIRTLIQELQRTATTKVILVTDLLIFDDLVNRVLDQIEFTTSTFGFEWVDEIPSVSDTLSLTSVGDPLNFVDVVDEVLDNFQLTFQYGDINWSDAVDVTLDNYLQDGSIISAYDSPYLTVGNKLPIGSGYPVPATGEYTGYFKVGIVDSSVREINDGVRGVNESHEVVKPPAGYEHIVYLDYNANVQFTAPSDSAVVVRRVDNYQYSTGSTTITTVNAGSSFNQNITDSHALILEFQSESVEKTAITVSY